MGEGNDERYKTGAAAGKGPTAIDGQIGRRIELRRLLLEIERHHLAGDLGILATSLARIEAGAERPEPELLARIGGHLGVGVEWFFRSFQCAESGGSSEPTADAKSAAWSQAVANADTGLQLLELADLFMLASAEDRKAILQWARDRVARQTA